VQVRDFTCGFKGFTRNAAQAIFARQRIDNWSFDAEVLFLARRLRLTIVELPVRWHDDRRTKVRLGRDIAGSFGGLVQIRLNQATGRYRLGDESVRSD
jgi:dolichyl-phosphate beta-glucosyltransferase